MNNPKQAIGLLFTLFILIASGWYYTKAKPMIRLNNDTLASTVDTTISQLSIKQFDADGLLINSLSTPLMQHIPKGNIHLIQTPHIVINEKDQPAWDITSLKAKSFDGGKRITFIQKVVIHQNSGSKTPESTLKTEEVTYYPKEKKATTDLFVTFEQPGTTIKSQGMNAYLDEKRVELLHAAKGSYVPVNEG